MAGAKAKAKPKPISEEAIRQGQALRDLRKKQGLNQTEVAFAFGMTAEGYRLYERGRTRIKLDSLDALAAALKVDRDTLIGVLDLTGAEREEEELNLEAELVRLTGGRRAGAALASAISNWKNLPASSKRIILATLDDALERAGEELPPRRR